MYKLILETSIFRRFLLLFSWLLPVILYSQTDTLSPVYLKEVNVQTDKRALPVVSSTPLQVLNHEELEQMPLFRLSDALSLLSGLVVKDYGGIGGMKTVSVRGLGAQQTMVAYNQMALTDCQTGQIDLGKFSLKNIESITLNSGQPDHIFLPARLFSAASLVMIKTRTPRFPSKQPIHLFADFTLGSFGLYNPSILLEWNIKKKKAPGDWGLTSSLSIEHLSSKGNYPYTVMYGKNATDSTSVEKRENSDTETMTATFHLQAEIGEKQELDFTFYHYHSARGLPGAVILYNPYSSERLWDENAFAQLHYENRFTKQLSYQVNAKFNYAYTRYLDPDYSNRAGELDNRYIQREYYLSNVLMYKMKRHFSISFANDLIYNNMSANLQDFARPVRFTCLNVLAGNFKSKYFDASANLLHHYMYNSTRLDKSGGNTNKLTPTVSFLVKPLGKNNFGIRAFYKQQFRMPTFNDLYYRFVGNVNLLPENTYQMNVGLTYDQKFHRKKVALSTTGDVYYNIVKDKIVAFPGQNLFVWSMMNYGLVNVLGVDVNAHISYTINALFALKLSGNYSYQSAIDKTDPSGKSYGQQIPYTPEHSGSMGCGFSAKWFDLVYSALVTGERYTLGQSTSENRLDPYFDHNIALSGRFEIKAIVLGFKAEMLNLSNKQYEVISGYPMPGRNYRVKLSFEW